MTYDIPFKRGEGRTVTFTITENSTALDVSAATISFYVKAKKSDTTILITKSDSDFDKTDAGSGIIYCDFSSTDTDITPKSYIGELQLLWTENSKYKSKDFEVYIKEAVN